MSIRSRVVVGVYPGQDDGVALQAAVFAARFDAELVCAWADPALDVPAKPTDALPDRPFSPYLTAHLERILGGRDIVWSTRLLPGDPARALGQLADSLRAVMIVVGTRHASVRSSLQELFAGSVAMNLAHHQHRPVVVVPLAPASFDNALPWESD
jgi:nucleotide-binding universal stress UspA family protein